MLKQQIPGFKVKKQKTKTTRTMHQQGTHRQPKIERKEVPKGWM